MIIAALPELHNLLAAFEADPADVGCLRALADCLEDECDLPDLAEACRWMLVAQLAWECENGEWKCFWLHQTEQRMTLSPRSTPPPMIARHFAPKFWNFLESHEHAMLIARSMLLTTIREGIA